MFGLMRNKTGEHSCSLDTHYRLHYCGTCKTMGTLYGQRTRPLLNFDTVFLSELLADLGNEQRLHWDKQYHEKSCFKLPQSQQDMPLSLQYAATVNVLLAELKVEDAKQEGANLAAKLWKGCYSQAFAKAEQQMQLWGLDMNKIWVEVQKQAYIEQQVEEKLDFASPTAEITALIFEKGAEVVSNIEAKNNMYAFGKALGTLVYWLDALEDYEKDIKAGKFNGIAAKYKLNHAKLSPIYHKKIVNLLQATEKDLAAIINLLPFSPNKKENFINRLSFNLTQRLDRAYEVENIFSFEWKMIKSAFSKRKQQAFDFAQQQVSLAHSFKTQLQYNVLFLAAFIAPKLPEHLISAPNEKDSFNFWAIAAAFLGALGLGRKAVKTCKHGKSYKTIQKVGFFSFIRRKDDCGDCCGDCASECCTECVNQCCSSCCESCCDSCCDSLCASWCGEGYTTGVFGMVIGGIIVIALIVTLLILLL